MIDAAAQGRTQAYIARLEEALAEYALRYGLTERARLVFQEGATPASRTISERGLLVGDTCPSASAPPAAEGTRSGRGAGSPD
jgi:hypothetical protein